MLSRDGSEISSLNQWYLSGLTALVATAFAVLSGGALFGKLNSGSGVRIELDQWAWLTDVRVNLEKPVETPAVTPSVGLAQTDFVPVSSAASQRAQVVLSDKAASAVHTQKTQLRKRSLVQRHHSVRQDQVAVATSAPLRAEPALNTQEGPAISAHLQMQQMHSLLRKQFALAVDSHFNAEVMKVAIAQIAPTTIAQVLTIQNQVIQKVVLRSSKPAHKAKRSVINVAKVATPAVQVASSGYGIPTSQKSALEVKIEAAAQKVEALVQMQKALISAFEPVATAQESSFSTQGSLAGSISSVVNAPSLTTQATVSGIGDHTPGKVKGTIAADGYSILAKNIVLPVHTSDKNVNTQSNPKKKEVVSHEYSLTSFEEADARELTPPFIEAFSKDVPVANVKFDSVTEEGNGKGWKTYHAEGFWPTLARATPNSIPLLSENTAAMLAWTVGAKAQRAAAIVFGKIPSGWTVSFSGRSEQGAFFNSENQAISDAEVDGVRQFVFSNAAPGAQMITLRGHQPTDRALIAIPVVAGQATYLDLTQISFRSVAGYVLDADGDEPRPLPGAQVRLAGTSGEDVFTSGRGHFEIPHVALVGDYPVYLETYFEGGYTHRYELNTENLRKTILYRVGDNRLNAWLSQLEGGVSPESSLLVATASASQAAFGKNKKLYPQATPLIANPSLPPENYSITEDGQLEANLPLSGSNPRFLSVQVPEGPVMAELVDEDKKVVRSHLFMAQPKIINMVAQ